MSSKVIAKRSTRRYFQSAACDHELRFGAIGCGTCCVIKPIYDRQIVYICIGVGAALICAISAP